MADLEAECESKNTKTPSRQQISNLRKNLSQLATLAEEQNYYNEVMSVPDSTPSEKSPTSISYSSDDTPEWSSGDATTTSSSEVSYGKQSGSGSPIGFLRAVFPNMDVAKLRAALARVGDNDLDMEAIVEELLTSEHILEIEERDLDTGVAIVNDGSIPWGPTKKAKSKKAPPALTVQKIKSTKVAITDVRQRQNHAYPGSRLPATPDPWSQLTSLATHLATLLPSHSASYFQSAFHSPQHSTPAKALRSCLASIGAGNSANTEKTQLFGMFDILRSSPTYNELTSEQRDEVLSDARLALRATQGNPDQALELVELLLDLETELDLGVYHTNPVVQSPTKSKYTTQLPSGPPSILSPKVNPTSPTSPRGKGATSQWQSIPERKAPQGLHPLAASIPAYNPGRKGKIKGSGNGIGKGGKGDVGELSHAQRMARLRTDRNEVLREATRYWKNGGSGNRGGEVAMYFAERVCWLLLFCWLRLTGGFRQGICRCRSERRRWMLRGIW